MTVCAPPRIIWLDVLSTGMTADGYFVSIYRCALTKGITLRIKGPGGAEKHQKCASLDSAKCNASTEIEYHRLRARWTE